MHKDEHHLANAVADAEETITKLAEQLDKLQQTADLMAVQYHSLHHTCTALLARSGASGPPYALQIATYREVRHETIKAIEDRLKPQIKTHEPSKITRVGNELVRVNGKKPH